MVGGEGEGRGVGGVADLSAIVNTCVQASSRPSTRRQKEAQHQRFMAPGEEKGSVLLISRREKVRAPGAVIRG